MRRTALPTFEQISAQAVPDWWGYVEPAIQGAALRMQEQINPVGIIMTRQRRARGEMPFSPGTAANPWARVNELLRHPAMNPQAAKYVLDYVTMLSRATAGDSQALLEVAKQWDAHLKAMLDAFTRETDPEKKNALMGQIGKLTRVRNILYQRLGVPVEAPAMPGGALPSPMPAGPQAGGAIPINPQTGLPLR